MAIQFSGLATGIDTATIVSQLMQLERAPVTRMEGDVTWLTAKLNAYKEFDTRLNGFLDSVRSLANRSQYNEKNVSVASDDFFSAEANDEAIVNTSYQVEVIALAQVQKSYTEGFASKTEGDFGTGDITITIGSEDHIITIDDDNNSLTGIMNAINDADIGIQASIINDGDPDNPYRMTFTAENVGTSFSVDSSGLTGGSAQTLGVISESQTATQAHIKVDGIDIYSDSNTISEAIPGVTLDLLKAEEGTTTKLDIALNNDAIRTNINAFISGYNDVVSFVTGQSTMGDTDPGILGGDSGLSAIKRHLQNMLTTSYDSGGDIKSLSQLGLQTQSDGQLSFDSSQLTKAIESDLDSIITLLVGEEDGDGGLGGQFVDYLESLTNSTDGLLAGREKSINDNIARIDAQIEKAEARLEKREGTLTAQFNAMEQLVSTMNSQSSFLSTQLKSLENLWNYKNS